MRNEESRRRSNRNCQKRRRVALKRIKYGFISDDEDTYEFENEANYTGPFESTSTSNDNTTAFDNHSVIGFASDGDETGSDSEDQVTDYESDSSEVSTDTVIEHNAVHYDAIVNEPLYEDSPVIVLSAVHLILYFVVTCNIPQSCISILLQSISYFLPEKNKLIQTKYLFNKYFGDHIPSMKRFQACRTCRKIVDDKNACSSCGGKIDARFLAQPTSKVFLHNIRDPLIWKSCQYFRTLFKYKPDCCSDIYDGSTYINVGLPISKNVGGFTFLLNTDGASKYKSSSWCV
jgi:hypothetical protein